MPDLTIEYHQRCSQQTLTEEMQSSRGTGTYMVTVSTDGALDACDCDGYRFRGKCRHVTALREKLCGWDDFISDETQTPQQEMEAVCPKCGSETVLYKMGV